MAGMTQSQRSSSESESNSDSPKSHFKSVAEFTFSDATPHQLRDFRKQGWLDLGEGMEAKLKEMGKDVLATGPWGKVLEVMREFVRVQRNVGCRSYIDPFIQASVYYVPKTMATTPVVITNTLGQETPCRSGSRPIMVSNFAIEATHISESGPSFGGNLDYTVVLVRPEEYKSFEKSAMIHFGDPTHLLLIMEAKGPLGMSGAMSHIEAQLLVMLKETGYTSIVGVLTNGLEWTFLLARISGGATVIHWGSPFISSANGTPNDDNELIAALLVECIRNPGTLPSVFTAGM
ncbi:hypothetical protein RQP46_000099 [Phenoliferia psychrophenolica]